MTVNKWIKNRIFAIAILLSIIFSSGYSSYAATAFVNQNDYTYAGSIKQEAKRVKSECLCPEKNAQIQIKRTVDGTSKEAKLRNRYQQPFIYGAIFSHNLFPEELQYSLYTQPGWKKESTDYYIDKIFCNRRCVLWQ